MRFLLHYNVFRIRALRQANTKTISFSGVGFDHINVSEMNTSMFNNSCDYLVQKHVPVN